MRRVPGISGRWHRAERHGHILLMVTLRASGRTLATHHHLVVMGRELAPGTVRIFADWNQRFSTGWSLDACVA
uniref:Putative secreted protein n=1 Tax=Anopheles darlingi TaxID=43151 RepID=A0A2M4D6R5_ANODA